MASTAQDCDNHPMTGVYLATTVLLVLSVAVVRHRKPAVSIPVVVTVLAVAAWNLARADRGPDDPDPSVMVALNVVAVQVCAASFFLACRRLVHGRWHVPLWMWIVAVLFGAASFVGMLPAIGITDGEMYYDSPVYVIHLAYTFALLGGGVLSLSSRQHDSSPHVRHVVRTIQAIAVFVVTFQVLMPALTSLAVAAAALTLVWTTGHIEAWSRSASRADRLFDSIGVFIFVVDREGRLQDWNGPAASLLKLMGQTASREMDLKEALGRPSSFTDGATVTLSVQGGELRTSLSVHSVSPLVRDSDRVLMFRPVRTSLESSSFPTISGALKGHDPATQTLGRKAALEMLRVAANNGARVVRIDVTPRSERHADQLMFLMARRLEAYAAEQGWHDVEWARLDRWAFVSPVIDPNFAGEPLAVAVDDLDLDLSVRTYAPLPREAAADFTRRVCPDSYSGNTAHGS